MSKKIIVLIALLAWGIVAWYLSGFLFGTQALPWRIGAVAGAVLVLVAAIVAMRRAPVGARIVAGLIIFSILVMVSILYSIGFPGQETAPFGSPLGFTIVGVIASALVVVALLLHAGVVQSRSIPPDSDSPAATPSRDRTALLPVVIGGFLLAVSFHTLYWLMVWDSTYDPIGVIWLNFLLAVALFTGIALTIMLPTRTRAVGLLVALLIPAGLIAVTVTAQRVGFRDLTAARAERIGRALEAYYEREAHYPERLAQLIPRDALFLPRPVILFGQPWCYDGGGESYRLGYVDREHWSDPRLFGRVSRTKGEGAATSPVCAAEIKALIDQYPRYFVVGGG